jgi:hypothetical protein
MIDLRKRNILGPQRLGTTRDKKTIHINFGSGNGAQAFLQLDIGKHRAIFDLSKLKVYDSNVEATIDRGKATIKASWDHRDAITVTTIGSAILSAPYEE